MGGWAVWRTGSCVAGGARFEPGVSANARLCLGLEPAAAHFLTPHARRLWRRAATPPHTPQASKNSSGGDVDKYKAKIRELKAKLAEAQG